MRFLLKAYHVMNILSIDVAVGAVVSALFFAGILNVEILSYGLISLGLTVWIIYTADHLRDAASIKKNASSDRHAFHQQHFKKLLFILVVTILVDIVVVLFVRPAVLEGGLILSGMVIVYLAFHSRVFFLKEVFVATLYTLGILLPSLSVTETELDYFHFGLMFQFFLIALTNLLLFSLFDAEQDRIDNLSSFVTRFGKKTTRVCLALLFVIQIFLSFVLLFCFSYDLKAIVILFTMTAILLMLYSFARLYTPSERYRWVGDAVFFLPALLFL
jgi:4-hydroxybenzoate polyprenyltransferase